MNNKRIALVHEWFSVYAGSERVTSAIITLFKQADIFCLVNFFNKEDSLIVFGNRKIKTTFIQKLPFAKNNFRLYFPFLYFGIRSLKLKSFDVIITSSHAFAHSVKTYGNQVHICYCHAPMRYVWDMQDS